MMDTAVLGLYFALTLFIGLMAGRGTKTMEHFATGDKSYNTFIVFACLSAAYMGGGFTVGIAEKTYLFGIGYVIIMWGFSLKEILIGAYIAPRMGPFAHAHTAGDIMGELYGKEAQLTTGICSLLLCAAILGAQIGAFASLMTVMFEMDKTLSVFVGIGVVIAYSTFGGIKSVIATQVFHFSVLLISIPLVLYFLITGLGGVEAIQAALPETHLTTMGTISFVALITGFLNFFLGETLVPPYMQRLLIGKNVQSTARGTVLSGLLSIPFFALIGLIGVGAMAANPELPATQALPFAIQTYLPVGLKGLAAAGIISAILSSADAFLNAVSVSFTQDVVRPLNPEISTRKALYIAKLANLTAGVIAVFFALTVESAIDILLHSYNFWTPFILVPLAAGIFGIRATKRIFWYSAAAGIGVTFIWMVPLDSPYDINGAIMGVIANSLIFFGFHRRSTKLQAAL